MRKITFLKTFFLALILLMGTGNSWGQDPKTIMTNDCSLATRGWTFTNNISGQAIQQTPVAGSYWLLQSSSSTKDIIISDSYDVSTYSNLKLTFKVATYGSGTDNPAFVEYSTDGGSTWSATTFTSNTPTSNTYVSSTWDLGAINTTSLKFKFTNKGTADKGVRLDDISLTGVKMSPCTSSNLAFASSTATKIMGDSPFIITPTTLNGTTAIAYSSTNADVATVNSSTGKVTIVGAGTTKIKADQAAGTHNSIDYCVGSAEYTLTVAPLDAPVATAATAITSSGFTANWEAVAGATSNLLDVYTKEGSAVELLSEDFSSITAGNNTEPSGSSSAWAINSNFSASSAVYQAGGAVKIGTSSASGSITTKALNLSSASTLSFDVKGWTEIEGSIKVSVDGVQVGSNITYAAKMADSFENKTVVLPAATTTSKVTIATNGAKRAFLDNITITTGGATPISISGSPFTVSGTSQVITALSEATDYYYRVRAVNGTVESANSNEIKTTTSVNTTPTIVVAESAVPGMSALVGSSDTKTVTISGQHLSADISLTLTGDNASMFSLDKTTITPTNGSVTNQVVTITYTPTDVGTHSAELKLNSAGAAEVTRALTGMTLLSAPTASVATDITTTGFTANWVAVDDVSNYVLEVGLSNNKLYESFDTQEGTGGNDNEWSGSVAGSNTVGLASWTLANAFGANKCIRLGTGEKQGVATTPALGLNGNATLTFRAGAWDGASEKTTLLLEISGGGSLSKASVKLVKGEFTSYSVGIVGGTTNTKVSFKGAEANNSRFFLDDVKVFTLTSIPNSPFTVSDNTSYSISDLSPSSVYTYTVKSKVGSTLSAASNEVTAITAINGAINANSLPACPDCNIAIADDGHLTVDANTTYASITAEAGSKITVADGKSLTVTELVLENDLNKAATVIGNISSTSAEVRQQLGTARNWYLASAISGASIKEIPQIVAGAPRKTKAAIAPSYEYLKEYNETTGVWDDATGLVVGRGYILKPTNDYAQFAFTGTSLTSGVQTIALSHTATIDGSNNLFKGYNLVGNPYPSYLNINALIGHTANYYDIAHTIWYRTHDGSSWSFPTFNAKSGVGVPSDNLGLVPPMQAFWVQATQATNLTFENSMRLHNSSGSDVPFKAPRQQANSVLRLQIDNGAVKDETVLYLNELAANALDSFDSPKMMNNGTTVPNIFTLAGGEKLIINGMNELANGTEIPLGVQANAGAFTVRATEFSNFAEGDRVELLDKLTGTLTDITVSDYAFSSATNINTADRFALRFGRVATDKQNLSNDGLTVFTHHNCIHVAASELALGSAIRVYNQVGQLVASQPVSGALNVVNAQLHAGVYVVNVNNITVKVILK